MSESNTAQPPAQALELAPSARLRSGLLSAGGLLLEGIAHATAMAFLMPPAGWFPRHDHPVPDATENEHVAAALTAVGSRSEQALSVVGRYMPLRRA